MCHKAGRRWSQEQSPGSCSSIGTSNSTSIKPCSLPPFLVPAAAVQPVTSPPAQRLPAVSPDTALCQILQWPFFASCQVLTAGSGIQCPACGDWPCHEPPGPAGSPHSGPLGSASRGEGKKWSLMSPLGELRHRERLYLALSPLARQPSRDPAQG